MHIFWDNVCFPWYQVVRLVPNVGVDFSDDLDFNFDFWSDKFRVVKEGAFRDEG